MIDKYSTLRCALEELASATIIPPQTSRKNNDQLRLEINELLSTDQTGLPLLDGLSPQGITLSFLIELGTKAYRYLGVGDEVRTFVGMLWADSLREWNQEQRHQFLFAAIGDRHDLFSSLDFAVEVFRRISFPAEFAHPWFRQARAKLGNDLYQRGFWSCLECFATRCPAEAVNVAERWIIETANDTERSVVSHIVGIARMHLQPEDSGKTEIDALDFSLHQAGRPEWRSIYIESWAIIGAKKQLVEAKALRLRDELATQGEQELGAWCYLLSVVTRADQAAWCWTHREIAALASPKLGISGRFNLLVAAISGWESANAETPICRAEWEDIIASLQPFHKDENGFWQRLESFLREIGQRAPERLLPFVERVIQVAGEALREKIDDHHNGEGLIALFRDQNIQTEAATRFCLGASSDGRRIGLTLFSRAFVDRLNPDTMTSATPKQLELIFREAQRSLMDFAALGRLHASLAPHFDRLDKELKDDFYGEVAAKCKNSNGYRVALKAAATSHPRITAILNEVETFFENISKAAKSPALQIQVPGYRRAESVFLRKFSRDVSRGADKYSIFAQLAKKVQLLYGRSWRMMGSAGELSSSSPLKEVSHSVEMPRMEFVDPEGQRRRRISAVARINELEG